MAKSRKVKARNRELRQLAKRPRTPTPEPDEPPPPPVDEKSQQRLLDLYAEAFRAVLVDDPDALPALLQEVKAALYERDFAAAFGKREYLEAYAARWSPTRSLGYATIFQTLRPYFEGLLGDGGLRAGADPADDEDDEESEDGNDDEQQDEAVASDQEDHEGGGAGLSEHEHVDAEQDSEHQERLNMLCIGGCAAEHLAFAHYLHQNACPGTLTLLDSAAWSPIASLLQDRINNPPTLSPYASAAAKAANRALLPDADTLRLNVVEKDALALDSAALRFLIDSSKPVVATLLFTLNELYTEGGIGKTTKFLASLGQALPEGSLLLVVDSPGSYSEATVGKEAKKYPMAWLLDHTLLQKAPPGTQWEKVQSEDSAWYRLPEDYIYPIPLENMRYQLHLYRVSHA